MILWKYLTQCKGKKNLQNDLAKDKHANILIQKAKKELSFCHLC